MSRSKEHSRGSDLSSGRLPESAWHRDYRLTGRFNGFAGSRVGPEPLAGDHRTRTLRRESFRLVLFRGSADSLIFHVRTLPSYPSTIQQARIADWIPFHTSSAKKLTLDEHPLSPLQTKRFFDVGHSLEIKERIIFRATLRGEFTRLWRCISFTCCRMRYKELDIAYSENL